MWPLLRVASWPRLLPLGLRGACIRLRPSQHPFLAVKVHQLLVARLADGPRLIVPPRVQSERLNPQGGSLGQRSHVTGAALDAVSYTHLRAHETPEHLVCRLL